MMNLTLVTIKSLIRWAINVDNGFIIFFFNQFIGVRLFFCCVNFIVFYFPLRVTHD